MDVRGLGYIGIGATDLAAWRRFGETLGVMVSDTDEGLGWRIDERQTRVHVEPGDDELLFTGWELPDAAALSEAVAELAAVGVATKPRSDDECARRAVRECVWFEDPAGAAVELYHGPVLDHRTFVSPTGVSGFRTDGLGFGHMVVGTPHAAETVAFYTEVMGFRVSDVWRPGGQDVVFLHCNPRHHSLAVVPAGRFGFYHFMLEAETLTDVGATLDRVTDAGFAINSGLGMHTNDHMVSFYCQSPSGFEVEFGCGGKLVDDTTWVVSEITAPSFWGHRRPG